MCGKITSAPCLYSRDVTDKDNTFIPVSHLKALEHFNENSKVARSWKYLRKQMPYPGSISFRVEVLQNTFTSFFNATCRQYMKKKAYQQSIHELFERGSL